jgi:hypothetical protein
MTGFGADRPSSFSSKPAPNAAFWCDSLAVIDMTNVCKHCYSLVNIAQKPHPARDLGSHGLKPGIIQAPQRGLEGPLFHVALSSFHEIATVAPTQSV